MIGQMLLTHRIPDILSCGHSILSPVSVPLPPQTRVNYALLPPDSVLWTNTNKKKMSCSFYPFPDHMFSPLTCGKFSLIATRVSCHYGVQGRQEIHFDTCLRKKKSQKPPPGKPTHCGKTLGRIWGWAEVTLKNKFSCQSVFSPHSITKFSV